MKRLRAALPIVLRDLAGIAGIAAATIGAWQIYHPAGWIAGGLFLLSAAWLAAKHGG